MFLRPLATLLTSLGRAAEALPILEQLARLQPRDAAVVRMLAAVLLELAQPDRAIAWLSRAAHHCPETAAHVHLTGQALLKLGLREPAIGAFYHALSIEGDNPAFHNSLAAALIADGQLAAAERHARAAHLAEPNWTHAATLTCSLVELGRFEDVLAVADQPGASGLASAKVLVNRSIALEGLGRIGEAAAAARAALAMAQTPEIEHHLAAFLLTHGEVGAEAWQLYESRLQLPGVRRLPADRRWRTGQDLRGAAVLLHAEQGLGDTIQFVRYAPLVAARGATVLLAVQPTLRRLLSGSPGVARVLAVGERLPPFDLFSPLLSLPLLFGTTLDTIPPPLPYSTAVPTRSPGPLRVGLAWAGSTGFVEDHKRSLAPELLGRLRAGEVELFSLQHERGPLPDGVFDLMEGVRDMADTVGRIAGLDLVIAVDTAVAHLAATMGKPVWLLSRFRGCWRWRHGRTDSPWYPTVKIYRQPRPGDWAAVLERVRADLAQRADDSLAQTDDPAVARP